MAMRTVLILGVLAATIAGAVWWLSGAAPAERTTAGRAERADVKRFVPRPRVAEPDRGEVRAAKIKVAAAEREALHRRITEAMQARAATRVHAEDGREERAKAAKAEEMEAEAPSQMIDRSGNRAYLTRVMTQELIPLADECYELAQARQPDLAGLMALNVELLGDEELGGVVDSVEVDKQNEIKDPELLECVRESLMATTLPPPEQGGRDAFMLSMKFAPGE
jgi:hypothetical protein